MREGAFAILIIIVVGVVGWGVKNASGFAGIVFGILSLVVFFGVGGLYSILVEKPKRDEEEIRNLKSELENRNKKKKLTL